MKSDKVRPSGAGYELDGNDAVFTSGVVSRLLGIPVWVLKQLDREDVVRPPRKRGRSRLYSKKELDKLERVWFYMREHRVNVHGVKVILRMETEKK